MESGILGFGIWNTAQGIRNPTKSGTESKFYRQKTVIQYLLKSGIHGVESRIPFSVGFSYMGQSYQNKINLNHFSGKTAHVILIVRGAEKLQPSSLKLNILSTDGRPLHTTSLRQVGGDGVHFSASFPTPAEAFNMQLKGKTKKNFQFERNSQSTVEPSHVVVKLLYARNEFTAPKSSYEFAMFFILNSGATEKFKFQIKETVNFKAEYSASLITVYQNRYAVVRVRFIAKSSAVPGSVDQLFVTVTGETSKVTARNIVSLMVGP